MRTWQGTRFLTCLSAAPCPVRPDFWKGTTMAEDSSLCVVYGRCDFRRHHEDEVLINGTLARCSGPLDDQERRHLESELERASCGECGYYCRGGPSDGDGWWLWVAPELELRKDEGRFLQLMVDYGDPTSWPDDRRRLESRVQAIFRTVLSPRNSRARKGTESKTPPKSWKPNAESETQPDATDDNGHAPAVEPTETTSGSSEPESTPTGFLGGEDLARALGIHATRREAFFRQLERKRKDLGDDCWHEVRDPRPNSPVLFYRADSATVKKWAAKYKAPKSG